MRWRPRLRLFSVRKAKSGLCARDAASSRFPPALVDGGQPKNPYPTLRKEDDGCKSRLGWSAKGFDEGQVGADNGRRLFVGANFKIASRLLHPFQDPPTHCLRIVSAFDASMSDSLLGNSQPAVHLVAHEALDLKQVIEIVSSLHSDKLDDCLPSSLVVNTIGRVPMLPRHGTQKREIALSLELHYCKNR
jgi:hypothetical protein